MSNWTMILAEEQDALKASGALWALGYLAVLRLKAAGSETLITTTRELAALWDRGNYRSVKRALNALSKAGLLRVESSAQNTKIYLPRGVEKSPSKASSERTQKGVKTNAERGQSERRAPSPSYSPNPFNEININKRQEKHVYIKAANAAPEKKAFSPKEEIRKFADKVALKFENFENQTQKNVWFYRNYRNLRDILAYGGSERMGLLTIQACAEMMEAKGYNGGYGAVCRNLPLYYERAKQRACASSVE